MTLAWTDVVFAYAAYLAGLAWLVPRFARARSASWMLGVLLGLTWWWPRLDADSAVGSAVTWVVMPSLALLGTYRVSGAFFVQPSRPLEHWLLSVDDALLHRTGVLRAYRAAPAVVPATFELLYLLVYAVVPAGAAVLLAGRHEEALSRYWATVFLAETACYALLPWLQSRPPRALETDTRTPEAPLRQLNGWLLRHGSIQVNTIPSAHAAGAIAVGLAVSSAMSGAGAVLLAIGGGITLATVLGRYHYAVDSALGVVVAVVSWGIVRS